MRYSKSLCMSSLIYLLVKKIDDYGKTILTHCDKFLGGRGHESSEFTDLTLLAFNIRNKSTTTSPSIRKLCTFFSYSP